MATGEGLKQLKPSPGMANVGQLTGILIFISGSHAKIQGRELFL